MADGNPELCPRIVVLDMRAAPGHETIGFNHSLYSIHSEKQGLESQPLNGIFDLMTPGGTVRVKKQGAQSRSLSDMLDLMTPGGPRSC